MRRTYRALVALALATTPLPAAAGELEVRTVLGSGAAGEGGAASRPRAGPAAAFSVAEPFGVDEGPDGGIWVCEVGGHRIVRVDPASGEARVVAGTGERGSSGDGGPAIEARLDEPYELRFDAPGRLVFVDMKAAVVRRIDLATGRISRVAGTGEEGFGGDGGPAVDARLRQPHSIAIDRVGAIYIADIGNHRIRRVDPSSGVIETIAGTGERSLPTTGTIATDRPLLGPRALAIHGETLWIALREGHSVWRMDLRSRVIRHVAGSGERGFVDGPGAAARFDGPKGIIAAREAVWVVDTENHAIREVDPSTGATRTIAGGGPSARGFGGDGGPARAALFDRPHGIGRDRYGRLLIGDTNTHRVRRLEERGRRIVAPRGVVFVGPPITGGKPADERLFAALARTSPTSDLEVSANRSASPGSLAPSGPPEATLYIATCAASEPIDGAIAALETSLDALGVIASPVLVALAPRRVTSDLSAIAERARTVARVRGHAFLDLALTPGLEQGAAWIDGGSALSPLGEELVGAELAGRISPGPAGIAIDVDLPHGTFAAFGGRVDALERSPDGVAFTWTRDRLPPAPVEGEEPTAALSVVGLDAGEWIVTVDGEPLLSATSEELARGVRWSRGPDATASEAHRWAVARNPALAGSFRAPGAHRLVVRRAVAR